MTILESFQSRTQIKPLVMGKRHPEVGVPVGINSELRDVEFLVPQPALDGWADLPFVEHEGLRMEDAPVGEYMAIDTDRRSLSVWIGACLPNALSGLQAHHVGGGQIRATPGRGDRMLSHKSEYRGTWLKSKLASHIGLTISGTEQPHGRNK